jgi:hypothetical protein
MLHRDYVEGIAVLQMLEYELPHIDYFARRFERRFDVPCPSAENYGWS